MIKSAIQTLITGRADGGDNTVSTERDLWTAILNTVYPTPIEVISSATTYATATSNTNYPYRLLFTKVGRSINVAGHFRNATTGTVNGITLMTITDAELKVSTATANGILVSYFGIARDLTNNINVYFEIIDIAGVTTFRIKGDISATTSGYEILSCTYNTLN